MLTNFQKSSVIYSQDFCQACTTAKSLLEKSGYSVEERKISHGSKWTKKYLADLLPNAKSVPQIFIAGRHIGGLGELQRYLNYNDYIKKAIME